MHSKKIRMTGKDSRIRIKEKKSKWNWEKSRPVQSDGHCAGYKSPLSTVVVPSVGISQFSIGRVETKRSTTERKHLVDT